MTDAPNLMSPDSLYKKVAFPRQHGPHDYFRLRGKAMRYLMLGTILIGQLTMGLWCKQERLEGAQRQFVYVERSIGGRKLAPEILAGWVAFGTSGSYNRDSTLPGWNTTNNVVDCIGGGGGGGGGYNTGYGGGGGGGGGLARYSNVGALGATFSMTVGGPGAAGGAFGAGGAGGNTQLDGWVGAYGGGGGGTNGAGGGAGGTYYAGTGYYPGGNGGGPGVPGGGGGGGGAGYYGGGNGGAAGTDQFGAGGAGGAGNGGGGGGSPGAGGGNGLEYGSWGSGGGGAGAAGFGSVGGPAGYYGGGGGGGTIFSTPTAGGPGRQGLLMMYYVPLTAPVVSTCSPSSGPTAGGQAVTIGGSGFINVTSVNIGGAPLTSVGVPNANTITGVTSAGGAGTYNVNVNVSGGVAAGAGVNLYTYVAPPTLSSCSPDIGPTIGGTPVTITGARFTGVTGVTFGGTAATSVVVVNSTTITCVSPAHAFGLVNVSVSGSYGPADLVGGFTYLPPSGGFNMPNMGI